MKLKNESGKDDYKYARLNNVYYEHTIEVSNLIITKIEIFIFAAVSAYLLFRYFQNENILFDTISKISISVCLLITARFIRKLFWGVKKETILVIKSLGIQITTTYHSNFKSSTFIPWHSVGDVIINEAVLMQRVIYYLAVLVNANSTDSHSDKQSLIPFFLYSQPRLAELKKIYVNIQSILQN